jgi:glycosyltransferase involved in cell wall biosynthesis
MHQEAGGTIMEGDSPFVSVIVPVYKGSAFLPECLAALEKQDYPPQSFEILIVFNDGSPPSVGVDSTLCSLRCLEEPTPGSYAARNHGILHATGTVLAFTDADCVPDRAWLRNGVQALTANPGCGFVGGNIELVPKSSEHLSSAERYEKSVHFLQQTYINQSHFAATANMFTTREVMDSVGRFSQHLKSGGDKEWGERAASLGFRGFYEPRAVVRHKGRTLGELLRKARRLAGGVVDRRRLSQRLRITGIRGFVLDWKEERAFFRASRWLLRTSNEMYMSLELLPFLIFGVRVMERWRVRLGAKSVRA